MAVDVTNKGSKHFEFSLRVDNAGGYDNTMYRSSDVLPGETRTIRVYLHDVPLRFEGEDAMIGMRYLVDPAKVTGFVIYMGHPDFNYKAEIKNIRAVGYCKETTAEKFFPFVDEFGQYMHRDWPGKVKNKVQLKASSEKEMKDLQANPQPGNWDKYGGWATGPKLEATGFFRAEKYKGKWWLVDPEGHLFWSTGIDCIGSWGSTPTTDREGYFNWLPGEDSEFAQFYGKGTRAHAGYYKKLARHKTFNFSSANLYRKYGKGWENINAELIHKRLRSWGINTIGNWSDYHLFAIKKTPYTTSLAARSKPIQSGIGYSGSFPDPFDDSLRKGIVNSLKGMGDAVNDPWCIGYFVSNELGWGNNTALSLATLTSPADQPAKMAFVDVLKKRYRTIKKLNKQWHTKHESWESLLQCTDAPEEMYAKKDLVKFYIMTAEKYFKTIGDAIKEVAPNKLYLGCRFAGVNETAALAAAKYCDVASYNIYYYDVSSWQIKKGVDKPVIIGEFHFGARDRGLFDEGLRFTDDQQGRADCYEHYIKSALKNPLLVGAHWFEYRDQCATGRFDGENYQIGFVDVCDQPYKEMIGASRRVGEELYEYRMKNK